MAEGECKQEQRPMCFGTYVSEKDIVCGACGEQLKKECVASMAARNRKSLL